MSKGIIVSVGAGNLQCGFIRRLRELGYQVAAFGKGKNSKEAIGYCNYFKEIDTSDHQEAISWLDSLGQPVIGAGSYAGGVAIRTLQLISNYYKLPTAVPENLVTGMDKLRQQQMYEQYGLSQIKTFSYDSLMKHPEDVSAGEDYILKPVIGRGSQGVRFLKGEELLEELNQNGLNENHMVQSAVKGREYRVLLMLQKGEIKLLAPVFRHSFKETFFLGRLEISFEDYYEIYQHASRMIQSLGIENSIIKYDVIVGQAGVNLIEMDIGVGGGEYYKRFLSQACGVNLMDVYIRLICGEEISLMECREKDLVMDYIYNEFPHPVTYDPTLCKRMLEQRYGEVQLIQNHLCPEKKGFYQSNADFLFTVIHNNKEVGQGELNEFVNNRLLQNATA